MCWVAGTCSQPQPTGNRDSNLLRDHRLHADQLMDRPQADALRTYEDDLPGYFTGLASSEELLAHLSSSRPTTRPRKKSEWVQLGYFRKCVASRITLRPTRRRLKQTANLAWRLPRIVLPPPSPQHLSTVPRRRSNNVPNSIGTVPEALKLFLQTLAASRRFPTGDAALPVAFRLP